MKKIICLIAGFVLLIDVHADPDRYAIRAVAASSVDLRPLFTWWAAASQNSSPSIYLTGMDTNRLMAVSNLWSQLPPRPLPDWFRISATETNIVVTGSMWRVNATIQPAPMMFKRQTIYLRNPPAREIHDFKLAQYQYASLMALQNYDTAAEQLMLSNIQVETAAVLPPGTYTNPAGIAAANPAQVLRLQQDSAMVTSNVNFLHARTQSRDAGVAAARAYLAAFPNGDIYWLDHFAMRTGRQVNGIEVYDMGAAPDLTY